MGKPEAGKYKHEFSQGTNCPGRSGKRFPLMGTCCLSSFLLARANYFWSWSHLHWDSWCLSNFNVSINHLEILLRCRFRFSSLSKSEGWGFKCVPFTGWCRSFEYMDSFFQMHPLKLGDEKGTCLKSPAYLHTEKRLESKFPGSQTQVPSPPLFISLSLMKRRTEESNRNRA